MNLIEITKKEKNKDLEVTNKKSNNKCFLKFKQLEWASYV